MICCSGDQCFVGVNDSLDVSYRVVVSKQGHVIWFPGLLQGPRDDRQASHCDPC